MKIIKLVILIIVRQFLKLGENIYHLVDEPWLTLKKLRKDRSQKYLMAATAVMPIFLYLSARIVWDHYHYGGVKQSIGIIFYIIFAIEILIFAYLGYWTMRVILKKHTTK